MSFRKKPFLILGPSAHLNGFYFSKKIPLVKSDKFG
jgi:hypothetical protein